LEEIEPEELSEDPDEDRKENPEVLYPITPFENPEVLYRGTSLIRNSPPP